MPSSVLPLLAVSALTGCAPRGAAPAVSGAAQAAVTGELAVEGPLARRLSGAPADLVLLYASEHKGSMQTCGCPKRPRGSLARLERYADAVRERAPATVQVHAGYWLEDVVGLDGARRPDAEAMNRWMVRGVREGAWDALNVGRPDVSGLPGLDVAGLPLVSANVEGPGIRPWVVVERGGQRVGITGITAVGPTLADTPGYTVRPPESVAPVVAELAETADVVVLLSYRAADAARAIVRRVPQVDVVVDADAHREFLAPVLAGSTAWVYSHYQTMRVGELRLRLDGGAVRGGLDRKIDLDAEMPDDPALRALQDEARVEIDAIQVRMYGP